MVGHESDNDQYVRVHQMLVLHYRKKRKRTCNKQKQWGQVINIIDFIKFQV